jgi:hypothetical protein
MNNNKIICLDIIMNNYPNTNIFLLCIVIVLFLIILLKNNEHFRGKPIPTTKIDLNLREYISLTNGMPPSKKASYSNKLSQWESNYVLDNPRLRNLYSKLYNRACGGILISRMGTYDIYLP